MAGVLGRIHIIGICGTGTGALAGLLHAQGWTVTGSDVQVYPPMSEQLAGLGLEVMQGYDPAHLDGPEPTWVIIGNVIRSSNPEAQAALARGLPKLSMPEAVARFGIGERRSLVVAGTHGKTTTTALLAHVLTAVGHDPSYLVGGLPADGRPSFHVGRGHVFVIEGDEYDSAFFDKGAKFLHYRPHTCIITSLEFDHADIFADLPAVEAAFAKLIALVPDDGHLVVWRGAGIAPQLARASRVRRVTVYDSAQAAPPVQVAGTGTAPAGVQVDLWLDDWQSGPAGTRFTPMLRGRALPRMQVPLWGEFSAHNALAVVAACCPDWCEAAALPAALASFAGVRRRMQPVAQVGGITLVDDFAHHPTAVAKTLTAAGQRWPGRPIWALFEPRSATARRNLFFDAYRAAFASCAHVIIAGHPRLQEVEAAARFSPDLLAAALREDRIDARAAADSADIVRQVVAKAEPDAVIMLMSNGDFDGLAGMLGRALAQARQGARA